MQAAGRYLLGWTTFNGIDFYAPRKTSYIILSAEIETLSLR